MEQCTAFLVATEMVPRGVSSDGSKTCDMIITGNLPHFKSTIGLKGQILTRKHCETNQKGR
jgi:hypothetical protein